MRVKAQKLPIFLLKSTTKYFPLKKKNSLIIRPNLKNPITKKITEFYDFFDLLTFILIFLKIKMIIERPLNWNFWGVKLQKLP